MLTISSELGQLRKELAEYKSLYKRATAEIDSLAMRLAIEVEINDQYREFFSKNPEYCNWLREHNAQFEAYKNSPFYIKISTVDGRQKESKLEDVTTNSS